MNHAPILILQMQRMGDLTLSFPLMEMLRELYPRNPLWVVGERAFFEPLAPLSPPADYFDHSAASTLKQQNFLAVINLSHRREAAVLAGELKSEAVIGQRTDRQGRLFVHGYWQLYRASLTRNNRYNLFHWSDLNCLDVIPRQTFSRHKQPLPSSFSGLSASQRARIGLFVGASEEAKRPTADFWTELAALLLREGFRPVLLGGPDEARTGAAIAGKLGAPALNLCGRFSIGGLARFIGGLGLLVVPDTGPMHIAARVGTPVLNLSLGPVNAWETGPVSPGHHVARARLACTGCWHCTRDRLYCRDAILPESIAALAGGLLSRDGEHSAQVRSSDHTLEVLRTGRDVDGLYALKPVRGAAARRETDTGNTDDGPPAGRQALSRFWQAWFGGTLGFFPENTRRQAFRMLQTEHPESLQKLRTGAAVLAADLARSFGKNPAGLLREPDFWQQAPEFLHPFSGYVQMYAQNASGSREAFAHILSLAQQLAEEE